MGSFNFDIDKAVSATLLVASILHKSKQKATFHKVFKILYFADRIHISKYARPILGDRYIAMEYGPVPSNIYDVLKRLRSTDKSFDLGSMADLFEINGYCIIPKQDADLEELSESEIDCIDESIKDNINLTFGQLTDKSHDAAYTAAEQNTMISYEDMAKTGGANEELISYMRVLEENSRLFG
jgi:uncharacterized phage-associated protein